MSLYDLFEACERTALGAGIKQSVWLFPAIESVHLLALGLLGGALLVLDLRLLGCGLTAQPIAAIERESRVWLLRALGAMVLTGALMFMSESVKLYGSPAFWVKACAIAVALAYTFGVRNPLARRARAVNATTRALGATSIALWLTVASAGRWIGFS